MSALLAAEWRKLRTGRSWWALGLAGLVVSAVVTLSMAIDQERPLYDGTTTVEAATAVVVRYWFMGLLFTAIFGAVFVTREHTTGAIARSVLVAGGRGRLLAAKVLIGTAAGAVYAAIVSALAVASPWVFLPLVRHTPIWSREATLTVVGVFACVALSATWGVLVGAVVRNGTAAVGLILVLVLLVDEAVFRLAPAVGRFALTIAMGAVFLDDRADLLPVPAALMVLATYLVGAGVLARWLVGRRDLP